MLSMAPKNINNVKMESLFGIFAARPNVFLCKPFYAGKMEYEFYQRKNDKPFFATWHSLKRNRRYRAH